MSLALTVANATNVEQNTRVSAFQRQFRIVCISGEARVSAVLKGLSPDVESTAFQSDTWLVNWFATVGRARGAEPHLMLATCKATGSFCLALPLVRWTSGGLTRLDAVDLGLADYVAPIIAADFAPSSNEMNRLWKSLLAQLPKADMLYLGKIPPMLGTRPNPLMLVNGLHRHRQRAWGTSLTAPPLDFTALGMPKKRSRELNNRLKRLQAVGSLSFRIAETAQEKDAAFAVMCAQRAARFTAMGRPNALDSADVRDFYRSLLDQYDGRSGAVLQTLSVNDEIIACGLGLVTTDAFLMIFPTIGGEEWKVYSPGLQHFRKSMEWTAGRGKRLYDFTLGSEAYKTEFGAVPTELYEIVAPRSLKGRLAAAELTVRRKIHERPELVRFLRNLLKPTVEGGK
ncbi:MAG: GNAT family N-acetyltransferase [Proteobacteria bacterium]|nr:GNAT family N-acetyltransferase [Pseudomonadota bacterium]